jgi:hypothetical protein
MYSTYLSDERRTDRENLPLGLRSKIGPHFVVALDFGTARAFRLCLVWPNFLSQRCLPHKG